MNFKKLHRNYHFKSGFRTFKFAWNNYILSLISNESDSFMLSKFFWRELNDGYYQMIQEYRWEKDSL